MTIVLIAAGAAGLALAAPGSAMAASRPGRVGVPNAQPRVSRSASSGRSSKGQSVEVKLYLAGRDAAGLDAAVEAVSTPGSSRYGSYLSAAQYRARYSPSDASVTAVKEFLTANHLKVSSIPANHLYVAAKGTVAQAETAFATTLENYHLDGHTVRAASKAPTVPASLDGVVTAVSGLASVSSLMTFDHDGGRSDVASSSSSRIASAAKAKASGPLAPPPPAFVNATPCSTYYGQKIATTAPPAYGSKQPYAPCGYVPSQLQGAYGLGSSIAGGKDGSGVTVAITDAYAAPTIRKDARIYANRHDQKALGGQFRQLQLPPGVEYRYGYDDTVNTDLCGEQGWYGEETLDVEAVHAVAPGANITYVPSASCDNGDFLDTLNRVIDGQLANIITNSWGGIDESNGSPELDAGYHQAFAQAALEGIGIYFSSGDSGDGSSASLDGNPTTEAPANDPLVTAVGGTSIAIGKNSKRQVETGWSTAKSSLTDGAWTPAPPGNYQYGAGGGTDRVFDQPWYQKGIVPGSLSKLYSSTPARVVPDVSAVGDPNTGFLVGETQTFLDGSVKYGEYRIGGTSLASPVFAGIMAISDQIAGHPHGFANPALYRSYGTSAFYDPKPVPNTGVVRVDYANGENADDGLLTSLRSIDVTNGTILRTRTGYDDVTGIGSVNGPTFFKALK